MLTVFTKRHLDAILDKELTVSFSKRLNRRIWKILNRFNTQWPEATETGLTYYKTLLEETEESLLEVYGQDNFYLPGGDEENKETDLEGFVKNTYPSEVLDVIEMFHYNMAEEDRKNEFTRVINKAFEEEKAPWRLSQGQFFKVDWEFFEQNILSHAHDILASYGFEGAYDEFTKARNDFEEKDYKDVILKACKSYESVLKTILNESNSNANALLQDLKNSGLLNDLPNEHLGGFIQQVLMALPFLRNRISGHGQGEDVLKVSKEYAELSLHLAGSFIIFLLQKHIDENCNLEMGSEEDDLKGNDVEEESDEIKVPF